MTTDAHHPQTGLRTLLQRLEEEREHLEQRLAFVRGEIAYLRRRLRPLGEPMPDEPPSNGA